MNAPDPRAAAQQHLEHMVGRGELTLAEFSDRAGAIWAAATPAELEAALAGLPGIEQASLRSQSDHLTVARPGSSGVTVEEGRQWSVLGDLKREGHWDLTEGFAITSILGDIYLDLRSARVDSQRTRIEILTIGGDVRVLLPPGVLVKVTGSRFLADLNIDETHYDGRGGPRIDLHIEGGLCAVKVKYLPAGEKVPTAWKWF